MQSPDPAYDCSNGLGRITLNWSGATGPVQVRMLTPTGPGLTGFDLQTGSATTGDWVSDGMIFFLVNPTGGVEAALVAHVQCGGSPRDSYFPLEVGNVWVFRANSRVVTSTYVTWTVTGSEQIGARTYMRIRVEPFGDSLLLRGDGQGRIYRYTNSTEILYFDPNTPGSTFGSVVTAVGVLPDTITQTGQGFLIPHTVYARGFGIVHQDTTLLAGSSGGFSDSLDLVEARLAGGVRLSVAAPALSVAVENAVVDVNGKKATNCAIPCYYAACGLGTPVDPPGTYKPCMQSRARIFGAAPGSQVVVELRDATDRVLFHSNPLGADGDERVQYVQLPLYDKSNQPLPPALYKVVARLLNGAEEVGTASYSIQVK